jgi:hypothetical protein
MRQTLPTVESVVAEAESSFERGDTKAGIATLAQALWIALGRTDGAREIYNRIERAAGVWESDA